MCFSDGFASKILLKVPMQEPGASADHTKAAVVRLSQEATPKAGHSRIPYSLTALQQSLQVNFVLVQGFLVVATPFDFKRLCHYQQSGNMHHHAPTAQKQSGLSPKTQKAHVCWAPHKWSFRAFVPPRSSKDLARSREGLRKARTVENRPGSTGTRRQKPCVSCTDM